MIWYDIRYMIYLSNENGLTHRGSSTVHIYIKTINRTKKIGTLSSTNKNRTKQIAINLEECGAYPVFASFNLAFVIQLTKKHRKVCQGSRRVLVYILPTHTHIHTHALQYPHTHTHTQTHITK